MLHGLLLGPDGAGGHVFGLPANPPQFPHHTLRSGRQRYIVDQLRRRRVLHKEPEGLANTSPRLGQSPPVAMASLY